MCELHERVIDPRGGNTAHAHAQLAGLKLDHLHLSSNLLVRGLCRKFALAQAERSQAAPEQPQQPVVTGRGGRGGRGRGITSSTSEGAGERGGERGGGRGGRGGRGVRVI